MRNNRIRMLSGIGAAVMLLVATGCQTTTAPRDERSEGTKLDDDQITENVKKSLDQEPVYKFTDVNVNTYAGVVQLSGFATIQGQKNRAQQLADSVPGVRQVVNGITLKPQLEATGRPQPMTYSDPPSAPDAPATPADSTPNQPSDQNQQNQQNQQSPDSK